VADKILQHALRFLKRRLLSKQELAKKLLDRHYQESEVLRIVELLAAKNILNDARLAEDRASAGVNRKAGRHQVARKLTEAGIDEAVTSRAVEGAFDTVDEAKVARQLLARKLPGMSRLPRIAQYRRAMGFLLRKGYDEEIARNAVDELVGTADDIDSDPQA
jgi:regulatory protein